MNNSNFIQRLGSRIAVLATTLVIVACSTAPLSSQTSDDRDQSSPYFRFWRGWKLEALSNEQFLNTMGTTFIPATPDTHAKNGLISYVVGFPSSDHNPKLPDEIALVGYESKAVYDLAKATPEGQQYSDLHWTVFDKSVSKSEVPISFHQRRPEVLESGKAYDMVGKVIDWQQGHTLLFMGNRKPQIEGVEFLKAMTAHVQNVANAFADMGLLGYMILTTEDYEIAFLNWESKAAAEKAFAHGAGKKVGDEAGRIMDFDMWEEAKTFNGVAKWKKAYQVKFERRSR